MTTPLDHLTVDELLQRTSIKWQLFGPDVLPLWVAEMDVTLAEPVAAALRSAVDRGDTGYPTGTVYADAMAGFARDRWGWDIDPALTAPVADVMRGIVEVLRLVTSPGDPVVVNSPVYTPFYQFVAGADRRVVESPLTESHRLDLAGLERTFDRLRGVGTSTAYLLCSPHNPTGTVHEREELLAVLALAEQYDVRVLVDEIHAPLVYADQQHHPLLTLPGSERAFVLISASKAWNLAGLKAALAIAGSAAASDLARMPPEVSHGPSHFGILAHSAALRDGVGWLDALLEGLDRNRALLGDLLAEHLPDVRYRPPEGTYLAWLDCHALDLGSDPAGRFLEHGVALNEGRLFGTGGVGHVRLNLATSPEILTEAVRRMAKAV